MSDVLAELFSSKVRAAVLRQCLPRPHLAFSLTELAAILHMPISSLQHECYKLERICILVSHRDGPSRRYQAAPDCRLLPELTALVMRSMARDTVLKAAIEGVPDIETCFLAQPIDEHDEADPIRLVVVGEVPLDALAALTARVELVLGAAPGSVELAYFRTAEWQTRRAEHHPYTAMLLAAPRTILLDRDGSLAELSGS